MIASRYNKIFDRIRAVVVSSMAGPGGLISIILYYPAFEGAGHRVRCIETSFKQLICIIERLVSMMVDIDKLRALMSRPAGGRQRLLDRFIQVCNELQANPYDVVSAAMYVCCIGAHDQMQLTKDVFVDMVGTFYDDVIEQRKSMSCDCLKGLFDAESN